MKHLFIAIIVGLVLVGCTSTQTIRTTQVDDGKITLKFVQVNDVYEIAPLSGGKYGGMARVAHVRDSIKKENPNTYLFMAGDFLNPSLVGTLKIDGERVRGRQMIEVMNAMDFDLVAFGNHEFDIGETALQQRLDESNFTWISTNTFHKKNGEAVPFTSKGKEVAFSYVFDAVDSDGTQIKMGFISSTIPSNPQDFVFYGDIYDYPIQAYEGIKDATDFVIGLTHLKVSQDQELSNRLPAIPFIMGGHEHNNMMVETPTAKIAKADANAKTVYVHTLEYDTNTKRMVIDSQLVPIDESVSSNPRIAAIVAKWNAVLETKIKEVISQPDEIIYNANPPLDGTDSASRGIQTNLGEIITSAMAASFNSPTEAALVNGGSIRIDDFLAGEVTAIDIFRVLPFGGEVVKVDLKGSLLKEVLDFGKSKGGTGAYLQRFNFQQNEQGAWLIGGQLIDPSSTYQVAFSDFLLKGYDIPFLTPENQGILKVYKPTSDELASDIRKAVIIYLKNKYND